MIYAVKHIESISHQPTFQNGGFSRKIKPLDADSALLTPDFKEFIPPVNLRRLSTILRMSIACAKANETVTGAFDGISIGTGLGCLTDTEKFLNIQNSVSGDILSPTAFIQSTHNTIGGQISLALGCKSYNMTHTQKSVSFEAALMDGLLLCDEGKTNVLVGSADEYIPYLDHFEDNLLASCEPLTGGSTAMTLEKKSEGTGILHCSIHYRGNNLYQQLEQLTHAFSVEKIWSAKPIETGIKHQIYTPFTGWFMTNSALACHFALDEIQQTGGGRQLILNNQSEKYAGITIVGKL